MARPDVRSRVVTLLLAGGIAVGAVIAPSTLASPAEAHHLPITQHKPIDLTVKLVPSEDADWHIKPGLNPCIVNPNDC